jgi:hypothetical protein
MYSNCVLNVLSNWNTTVVVVDVPHAKVLRNNFHLQRYYNKLYGVKCGVSDGYFNICTVNITVCYS